MPAKIFFVIEFDRFCQRILPTTVSGSVTMRLKPRHLTINLRIQADCRLFENPHVFAGYLIIQSEKKTTKTILIRSRTLFRALCQMQLSVDWFHGF